MPTTLEGPWQAGDLRIAIVVSRFNDLLTEHMASEAVNTFRRLGGDPDNGETLVVVHVPGSFELPMTAQQLALTNKFDAVICLGCVIRGETDHYDHVVAQTAKGIREAGMATGVPVIFGVLTTDNVEQALNRAGVKMGNNGNKAMLAAVEMAHLMKQIRELAT